MNCPVGLLEFGPGDAKVDKVKEARPSLIRGLARIWYVISGSADMCSRNGLGDSSKGG